MVPLSNRFETYFLLKKRITNIYIPSLIINPNNTLKNRNELINCISYGKIVE